MQTAQPIITPGIPGITADKMLARKTVIELDSQGVWHASALLNYYREDNGVKTFAKDEDGKRIEGQVSSTNVVAEVPSIPQLALAFSGMEAGIAAMDAYKRLKPEWAALDEARLACQQAVAEARVLSDSYAAALSLALNPQDVTEQTAAVADATAQLDALDDLEPAYAAARNPVLFNLEATTQKIVAYATAALPHAQANQPYYVFAVLSALAPTSAEVSAALDAVAASKAAFITRLDAVIPLRDALAAASTAGMALMTFPPPEEPPVEPPVEPT